MSSVVTMVTPFADGDSELVDEVSRLPGGRLGLRVVASQHNGSADFEAATIVPNQDTV